MRKDNQIEIKGESEREKEKETSISSRWQDSHLNCKFLFKLYRNGEANFVPCSRNAFFFWSVFGKQFVKGNKCNILIRIKFQKIIMSLVYVFRMSCYRQLFCEALRPAQIFILCRVFVRNIEEINGKYVFIRSSVFFFFSFESREFFVEYVNMNGNISWHYCQSSMH